ncbi:MAG TPA: hypothetical protein VMT46_07015 [Anaerolineaceae bacterium]|nr:hypothetical protein [Anaerolineaceae bacterium]
MTDYDIDPESFWDNLLSRDRARIEAAFQKLDPESQKAVLAHLKRMATEEGWHPLQRDSAQAALDVLFPSTRV